VIVVVVVAAAMEGSFRRHSYTLAEEVCRNVVVEAVTLMLQAMIRSLFSL
jgi:hypothetical protein